MSLHCWYRLAGAVDTALLAAVRGFAAWDRLSAHAWLAITIFTHNRARQAVDRLNQVTR